MASDAYPLKWPAGWPRTPQHKRREGTFSRHLDYNSAMRGLQWEMGRLRASHVVVSSNIKPRAYQTDPDADARDDPGVAVYFMYGGKEMSMAQDAFDRVAKNIRSLTLAIEAMRAIERHGGGFMMQQAFQGFAQLPPPTNGEAYTKRPWRDVLQVGDISALPNDAQIAIAEAFYKRQARTAHPDAAGGSAEAMAELNVAITEAREELQ